MSYCATCGDTFGDRKKTKDSAIQQAQIKASEEQKAIAVCEESDGSFFAIDAATAFQQHFRIVEVVSGLSIVS